MNKEYWKQKKREQRAKQTRESTESAKREKNLSGGEKVAPSSINHVAHDPAQNNLPVPVLAEPQRDVLRTAGARESTLERRPTHATDSRGGQSFSYDKKKYPNRQAWEIAVQRVERAIRYAEMFPHLIGSDDLKFQTLDWQYHNEGVKAPTS